MNWEAVNAVAGVIGVLAIVISLIYVAIEIRQNTKVARAATRQAISEAAGNLTSDLMNNREMAEIFVKHMNGKALDTVEKLRLEARCYRDFQHWENVHYQHVEGFILGDQWNGFRNNLRSLLRIKVYREFWAHEARHFSNGFQAEVSRILAGLDENAEAISDRFLDPREIPGPQK